MENRQVDTQGKSPSHISDEQKPDSYDPDRYVPDSTKEGQEEGIPLEQQESGEGYSTDARQGKESASLHLADEDMDRQPEDPEKDAQDLKQSFEKLKDNSESEKH